MCWLRILFYKQQNNLIYRNLYDNTMKIFNLFLPIIYYTVAPLIDKLIVSSRVDIVFKMTIRIRRTINCAINF